MTDDASTVGDAFPRLQSYVKTLPQGFQSYANCQGKSSLFSLALQLQPVAKFPDGAPAHLKKYFDTKLPPNQWVPELDYCLFTVLMADIHGWDSIGIRRFWSRVMNHINNSAMYGLLFRFLSARMLITTVASRWSSFHKGTTCKAEKTPEGLTITLGWPEGLFPELIVHGYLGVFDALAAHSRLIKGSVELAAQTSTSATYLMRDLVES